MSEEQEQVATEAEEPAPKGKRKTSKKGDSDGNGDAEEIDPASIARRVEAILISVDRPITHAKIADALGVESPKPVNAAIKLLNKQYEKTERSFRIEQVAGGFQILTMADCHDAVAALHKTREDNKLSPAALETLAIIAYKQPIIRAQIEAIRGVASGEIVRSLMEKHLVKIVGRAEEVGRPMLYGTTKRFLEVFGLSAIKDLPNAKELQKP